VAGFTGGQAEDLRRAMGVIWLVNLGLCGLTNLLSPLVAAFYGEPRLQLLLHVLSLQFLLLPLTVVPDVQLQRRLDYRQRSLVELSAALVGSQATLALALAGTGVWALVGGMLGTLLWRAGALNWCVPGQPRPDWSLQGMGGLLGFGGSLTATRLLWYSFMQADVAIVGRVPGEQMLGWYSVSMHLASLPMQRIAGILNHVLFPEWRLSPFLQLGTGVVYVEPRATIVLPADRTDQTAYIGTGLRFYLTRRFFVRADYRWHTIFTSRDDNQELEEWKVQIACFF
jgi:hypothetical protein